MGFCFVNLGLLLQLKGHPNDCQEIKDVSCRFNTLAEFGHQQNAKLSPATGDTSLSAAGFLFQLVVHPWRVAQAPLFSHQVQPFVVSANFSWAARAASGTPLFPTPVLQRAAESQEHPGHVLQQ